MPWSPLACRVVSFSFFFFSLQKGKGGDTHSHFRRTVRSQPGGEEGGRQHGARHHHLQRLSVASGELKIAPTGRGPGCGRMILERRVWVWTLTTLGKLDITLQRRMG